MRVRLESWPESARALWVFLFAFLFWCPALWNQFAWDDTNNLVDSARLRGFQALIDSFTHDAMWSANMNPAAIGTYRPISLASFVVDHAIFGGSAWGYHLTSLLWHALASVVVYLVFRRFTGSVAAAAITCLWNLVPVNAEAVAWVNGRSEIFALLFGGLAVLAITRRPMAPLLRGLVATPLLLLAMMGKETGVIFCAVAVLLGTELRHRLDGERRGWLRSADWVAFASGVVALVAYLLIRRQVFGGNPLPGAADKLSTSADLLLILSQSASIIWKCFLTLAIPDRISVGYLYLWAQSLTTSDLVIAWGALVVALIGVVVAFQRGHRLPVLLLAWWAFSIGPVFFLVGRDWPGLSRWLYMGGPGLVGGLGLLLWRFPVRRVALGIAAAYAVTFGVQAQRSIQVWHDSRTLFERMIIEEPKERFGFLSLAWYYLRAQRYPESEAMARKVLELGPRGHDPLPFLAAALAGQEKCDEAKKAVYEPKVMPTRGAWMMYAIGACYDRAQRPADSLPLFKDCAATDKACAARAEALASEGAAEPGSTAPSPPTTNAESALEPDGQ